MSMPKALDYMDGIVSAGGTIVFGGPAGSIIGRSPLSAKNDHEDAAGISLFRLCWRLSQRTAARAYGDSAGAELLSTLRSGNAAGRIGRRGAFADGRGGSGAVDARRHFARAPYLQHWQ